MSRALLTCGIVATPLFFAVALAQAATRDGYHLGPHMISQLATGDGGWVQVANFVGTGLLFVLGAAGARRALPRDHRWLPRLLAVFGGSLVAAGVFVADPANGYPVGAPDGATWHGAVHLVAATVSGLALTGAIGVEVRRSLVRREPAWAAAGVLVVLVSVLLPAVVSVRPGLMVALASLVGWAWLGVLMARLRAGGRVDVVAPERAVGGPRQPRPGAVR